MNHAEPYIEPYLEYISNEKAFLDRLPSGIMTEDEVAAAQLILDYIRRTSLTLETATIRKTFYDEARKTVGRNLLKAANSSYDLQCI